MNCNILIVDDSATTRAVIKRTIRLAGLTDGQIYEVDSGRAGLEMLGCVRIDLVLADLHMPLMNGEEMARQALANPTTSDIPIIVISAEPNIARLQQLVDAGVKGFLRKPFTPEQLRDCVGRTLEVCHG